jgi:hypothetical protein
LYESKTWSLNARRKQKLEVNTSSILPLSIVLTVQTQYFGDRICFRHQILKRIEYIHSSACYHHVSVPQQRTEWSWVLLEKPSLSTNKEASRLLCSQEPATGPCPKPNESSPSHVSLRNILLSVVSHLRLDLTTTQVVSLQVFRPEPRTQFSPLLRATYPAHHILLQLILQWLARCTNYEPSLWIFLQTRGQFS